MRTYTLILSAALSIALCSSAAVAQDDNKDGFKVLFNDYMNRLKKTRTVTNASPLIDAIPFVLSLAPDGGGSIVKVLAAAEEARVDKQVGGSDQNSGSTTVVRKGSVPSVLGFAVENGAIKQSVTGTTVTFQTNPT